jgi:hypothetical protein
MSEYDFIARPEKPNQVWQPSMQDIMALVTGPTQVLANRIAVENALAQRNIDIGKMNAFLSPQQKQLPPAQQQQAYGQMQGQQAQQQQQMEQYQKILGPIVQEMMKSGDNEGFQKLLSVYENMPGLAPMVQKLKESGFTITGSDAKEFTRPFTAPELKQMAVKVSQYNPELGQALLVDEPGTYKVKMKGNRIEGIEAIKDTEKDTTNSWVRESHEVGPDGKPTAKALQAKQYLKDLATANQQKVHFTIMEREAAEKKKTSAPFSEKEQHQVDVLTNAISEGRMAPSQLNTAIQRMGGGTSAAKIRTAVVTNVLERGTDLEAAENNYKAKGSSTAIQRVQLAKTVIPIADELIDLTKKIPPGIGFVPADEINRKLGRYLNNDELILLEFDKNKMVEEFERMLTGAQMADSRVQRNLELIRTGYDPKAIAELAEETKKISKMSTTAVTSPMYDLKTGKAANQTPSLPSGYKVGW